jgi:hypothetical protein
MWEILIGFIIGCIYTRTYYARINTRTDWMRSLDWFKGEWYKKLHMWNCEFCPKRWYCDRYNEQKILKENEDGRD